ARRYLAPQHLPAFSATLEVPAGRHQFHVRTFGRDGEWVSGAGGWLDGDAFTLDLDAPRRVTFRFSPVTRWVADDVRQPLAIATGTFQRALGCERDWQDDCLQTWLQDADGDGRYTLQTRLVPVGQHEVRPAVAPAVGPVTVTPFQVLRRYEQLRFVWTRASTRVVVEFPERPATGGASPGAPAL
ncbi:MAG: hypothetical protein INH37_22520, partial [Myxococcaceae bacterium]|nr:hypothetical protein [Myxococcaceae bacterium]